MTPFEIMYLAFGSFVILAGVTMITTYTLTYPWWGNHLGRMMITYATAEVAMSFILLLAVVWHAGPEWFRWAWFALQTVVGCTFCFQTYTIIHLHRQRRSRTKEKMQT